MQRTADAYPFSTRAAPLRFGIAIGSVSLVFFIKWSAPAIDDGSHLLILSTAVMATAWFAGTGPALAATVLGAWLGAGETGAEHAGAAAPIHLALFVLQGLILTAVVAELRAARREAERRTEDAERARQETEAASRMKDEFLATVSHELRTPLNAVQGWVHLLRTGTLDEQTTRRGLDSIDRNVRLQAQVTAHLLDVSKALTGRLQIQSRPSSLAVASREANDAVEAAARAKGVSVVLSLPDRPVVVLGDPTRLRQIVWHLLGNAIKFTERGGRVDLSVDAVGDVATVIVRDTGPGIAPSFLPRVFDRFSQADTSPTRTAGGLGVGLALVRELVELHGGQVEAGNRQDCVGAVFSVRFPLQPADFRTEAGVPPLAMESPLSPPLDGLRVLVLDEDIDARDLLQTMLRQRGATVRTVGGVADALESLEGWRPDVLVTDSGSPDHGSYALVGKVLSLDAEMGGRIPAVALTSVARTDQRLAHLMAGVQREVPKPVEPALLIAEIARLSGRERRRAPR